MSKYIGIIHKEPKSSYGVSFPDFPGCVTAGKTPEEAHAMAEEALQFHIEGMLEDGEKLPEPTSYAEAEHHPFFEGAVMTFMIEVAAPSRRVRVNINIEEDLLKRIDAAASNRSAFLAEAARHYLEGK